MSKSNIAGERNIINITIHSSSCV